MRNSPAFSPSHGATSLLKSSAGLPGVCSTPSRRVYGSAWCVSACPAASASVFRLPDGRTTAPTYTGAEAGTTPAGSALVPVEEPEPQPASAAVSVASATKVVTLRVMMCPCSTRMSRSYLQQPMHTPILHV